ncbi:MAG: 2-phosphosulfolactate phosphatase, partial [Candidatus Hodarchaeales archaeon]
MNVHIFQPKDNYWEKKSDINVVIDVLRAFTVTQILFKQGAIEILLAMDVKQAFELKDEYPNAILIGESQGYSIPGFDFTNSPSDLSNLSFENKKIIFKTTNGVKTTLKSLNAAIILVTGFKNAKQVAQYLKKHLNQNFNIKVNLIASHPTSDDDVACAEYIRDLLLNDKNISINNVI